MPCFVHANNYISNAVQFVYVDSYSERNTSVIYKTYKKILCEEIVDDIHVFMPCMDYTELSPLQKLHFFLIWGTYYFNQECGDLFDLIGNSMLKRYKYR
jgi:hypothetical protein